MRILIAERRREVLEVWREVFRGFDAIRVVDCSGRELASSGVDAELLPGWIAHERYGGRPRVGESQVLSTRGERAMPPSVVAVAPLPSDALGAEEHVAFIFRQAFLCIQQFNAASQAERIDTLAVDFQLLKWAQGDVRGEAEAILLEYSRAFPPGTWSGESERR